uniref:p53 DNA-binding domain-containing protein n=1 Tax=Anopheles marajoara TaxID=58244 RepID=A0A2M4BP25_9DIPT
MDLENAETFGAIQPSVSSSQVGDFTELLQRINTADLMHLNTNPTESAWDDSYFANSLDVSKLETDKESIFVDAMKPFNIQSVSIDKFSGVHDFNISFIDCASPTQASSNSFYSRRLDKLFVKKQHAFSVNVSYKSAPFEVLRLRMMLICAAPQDLHRPISRCQNDISKDPIAASDPHRDHILRCLNPSTMYVGTADGVGFHSRLATIIELTGTGQSVIPVSMEFLCQNSCPTIERRSTALVFTLERPDGTICGRQMLPVKICSCPKRDKEKEETKLDGGKRKKKASAEPAAASEPPRKLTRQSSSNESGARMQYAQMSGVNEKQRDSPSTSLVGRIKKEVDGGAVVRSNSNVSNCSSTDGDSSAIMITLKLPDIAVAVDVAEFAFSKLAANMVRSSNEEEYSRYARFLASCRRVKSKYAQFL